MGEAREGGPTEGTGGGEEGVTGEGGGGDGVGEEGVEWEAGGGEG